MTSIIDVLYFHDPNYYIDSKTRFILEAKDDLIYAIARQTDDSELLLLSLDEKTRAHGMSLVTDDGSLLQCLKELLRVEYERKQYAYFFKVLPTPEGGIPTFSEEPGEYGVRKDGTQVFIRNI